MRNLILVVAAAFIFTGCETFTGQLELYKPIKFVNASSRDKNRVTKCDAKGKTSKRCERARKRVQEDTKIISAGVHRSKVKPGKNKVEVEILDNNGKKVQAFNVKVPDGAKLPKFNGDISVLAKDSGFNYDIEGDLISKITNSDLIQAIESCSWTESYEVEVVKMVKIKGCVVTQTENCKVRKKVWETKYKTYWGEQRVEYFYEYTDKDLAITFIKPSTLEKVADFNGKYHGSERIDTFEGYCMGRHNGRRHGRDRRGRRRASDGVWN